MTPKKTTKFHFKIQFAKKTPKRKLFFYDENANDIPEVDEEEPPQEDSYESISSTTAATASATATTPTPSTYLEVNNSSITIINDDSGCFSSDTSWKFSEYSSEKTAGITSKRQNGGGGTQRTGIDGSFWDINDDSNQEAFIAIYVKKSLDVRGSNDGSDDGVASSSSQCVSVNIEKYEELPQELSTVSIQVGEDFCLRTLDSMRENGKKRKKGAHVHQRKNEWRKFKSRQ